MLGQPVYFLDARRGGRAPDAAVCAKASRLPTSCCTSPRCCARRRSSASSWSSHGEGAASLPVTDRATIANMAPEYGATMGFFPVDEESCIYLRATGRRESTSRPFRSYYKAQGMFGIPQQGECDYSTVLDLDLASVRAERRRTEAPAGSDRTARLKRVSRASAEAGRRGRLRQEATDAAARRFTTRSATGRSLGSALAGGGEQRPEPCSRRRQDGRRRRARASGPRREMVNNRPTPDRVVRFIPKSIPHG